MHLFSAQPGNVDVDGLAQLWHRVCTSRGTPAPDAVQCGPFLQSLGSQERSALQMVLTLAAKGQESRGDLALLSWAAACTRPALQVKLEGFGLGFTRAGLFACGMELQGRGWDIAQRIAQLADHPEDVDTLRAMLPGPPAQAARLPEPGPEETPQSESAAPQWPKEPMDAGDAVDAWDERPDLSDSSTPSALPVLPTRFEREARPSPSPSPSPAAVTPVPRQGTGQGEAADSRLRLRLFGKSAAHTLEVTDHRRGGDFMGTHVVSIDSAHALSTGGAYSWDRKLVLQLTPEEMPAIMATLMGITASVRFSNHGSDKSKFIEMRRQEHGLVIVTGDKAASYSVPVSTATAYYVLELFCRAMARDGSGRSVSDILALVKAAHGF